MKKFFILIMLLCLPGLNLAQDYLEVTAPGNRQPQLAIAPPVPLSGTHNAELDKTITDIFAFDLTLAGQFTVMPSPPGETRTGIRSGEFDLAPWQAAGANLLVKSGYIDNGATITMEFRFFDVSRGKELVVKRFTGKRTDQRKIVHMFSNEILSATTGETGPFTGKTAFVSTASGNKEIYLMDYDGYNVQRLTKNGSINLNPDFSPSGKELIYTSYKRRNPDLYRRELLTGAEARISSHPGINVTGAWSPDGTRIALAMSKDGNSEIYTISKDGKQVVRLTKNEAIDVSPAWSPDGSRIAFVSDRLGKPQIFVMNADGSHVTRLTTSGTYNVSPRWSPKGNTIAYCRQEGGFQIHVINVDGSNDIKLTSDGSNEHPRWSPDGRFIVFSSSRAGKEGIYVMRNDGTGQVRVSRGSSADSHPTWSPRW
ncbi:biopolymer transport periplasmic beta-propeller repeat protein, TolB-related [Geotalea daltonii FRC-32]|uniref:Biopolymer transport periplasmic beta-propeller repeat protein, TolB-related n=2 Tax=Geotalea TaxID=2910589 RepID=B9M349_GEODF|nr:biopolymer transport periplasmic beta-propeller repeat protein, TolB-related [Geotalea daltonii FRC-32]